jgi:mono/diheme cytochrome c family protein
VKTLSFVALALVISGINLVADAADTKTEVSARAIAEVATSYRTTVEPIFKKSCLDCHGQAQQLPWYFSIPGPKQLIEHDIKEAKENIDMTNGFPFKGKASIKELVSSIRDVIEDQSMPPFRYRILHRDSEMTDAEKAAVLKWIRESEVIVEQ